MKPHPTYPKYEQMVEDLLQSGKVWCEAGQHWVWSDEYDREKEMCISCREQCPF